jgi:hypothetical protein
MRRARNHQQRPVIFAQHTQSRRPKQPESPAASHDDKVGIHGRGMFDDCASG